MSNVDGSWYDNFRLNFRTVNLPRFIVAYKEAGDRLVDDIMRDQSFQDELALPIAFLYQHYLELGLKHLIFIGNQLLSSPTGWKPGFPIGHNLKNLLDICKDTLVRAEKEHAGLKLSELHMDEIEACITNFYCVDIFAYRYPIDKEGKLLLDNSHFINIHSLSEAIGRVDIFFFAEAIMAFSDFLEQKRLNG
jgi:hypothetical protein